MSFPCSIHRQQWPFVMAELQSMRIERRARRATVELRDELYAANLLPSFMDHASRWRHVLAELQYTFGYRHNDTVHDTQPESLDNECNIGAAFLEHRRVWLGVMTELLRRPVTPSHDHVSPLQRRRRRVLAPLRLTCCIRRNMTSCHIR